MTAGDNWSLGVRGDRHFSKDKSEPSSARTEVRQGGCRLDRPRRAKCVEGQPEGRIE
jgi:hypothetical protein